MPGWLYSLFIIDNHVVQEVYDRYLMRSDMLQLILNQLVSPINGNYRLHAILCDLALSLTCLTLII
jgi:hypothetical protein